MNPNEIPGWLDQHGGADGPPQTDANGVTTHRARDGSYVTVFNGQVRMISSPPMQQQTDEQAPAQPAQRPGGGMDQAALEARIAELQKQYPGLRFMGRSVKEKNRSRLDEDTGRTVTETVSVPTVEWRDPATGYTLTAEVGPGGGSYTVTEDRIIEANKGKNGEDPNDPDARNKAELQRQRERNAALPADQDPAYETDAERRQRAEARIKQQGQDAKDAEARNKPSVRIEKDASGRLVAISTYPDGRVETKDTGVRGDPATVKEGGVVYERQPDGTYKPAAGIPTPGQARKNIDAFTPDYSQPDLGLGAWAAAQRQKIGLPPDQGGITQADYDAAATEARGHADVAITNITNSQGVVRQQALDEQTQRNRLSDAAAGDLKDARSIYEATWKYANPDSDARFSTIPYLLEEAKRAREAREGTAKPMPALHPMFRNLAQQAGVTPPPGAATGGATPPPPTSVPPAVTAAAAQASGAVPPAPSMTPDAFVPAPAPAQPVTNLPVTTELPVQATGPNPTINPATGEPTGLNPLPEGARGPTPAINPITGEPTGLPQTPLYGPGMPHPGYPVEVQQPTNLDPNSEGPPPYNPGPGEAGHRPGEPVGMAPGPVTGWAMQALAQPPGTVAVQPQGMNPALQQAAQGASRQPQFDPFDTAGRLAAMGVPQDAVAQAMRELGLIGEEVPA